MPASGQLKLCFSLFGPRLYMDCALVTIVQLIHQQLKSSSAKTWPASMYPVGIGLGDLIVTWQQVFNGLCYLLITS